MNSFISYLNTLHNITASGANALAESQAVNPYFCALYEPFPIAASLKTLLEEPVQRVVVLTGHAGDGKSTVALDLFKTLRGTKQESPLDTPLREHEPLQAGPRTINIVKDMSEFGAAKRQDWLKRAFDEGTGSWLIVSNTGPLLHSLREYARAEGLADVEDELLLRLDESLDTDNLTGHEVKGFSKPLLILNLTRLDNTDLGARVLGRLIRHPGWDGCNDCDIRDCCPIALNHGALREASETVQTRVRWLYRRTTDYDQRLTLRQIVAQFAFAMTGGMDCREALAGVESSSARGAERGTPGLQTIVFSEGFFGYRSGKPSERAESLRAIALLRKARIGGPVSPRHERITQEQPDDAWGNLPESLNHLAETWRNQAGNPLKRAALRRLQLLFATPRPGRETEAELALDMQLRSPGLRLIDSSRTQGRLTLTRRESGSLLDACLGVLREAFSGFGPGQFDSRDDELYLTLRRPDQAVVQPTQLVVGSLSFRDFDLDFDPAARLPKLVYRRHRRDAPLELLLSLPLLDYILRRATGELGNNLAPIHQAQLDGFQSRLAALEDARSGREGLIELLRADISGKVDAYRYFLEDDRPGKPARLVMQ